MSETQRNRDEAAATAFRLKVEAALEEYHRQWRRQISLSVLGGGAGVLAAFVVERLTAYDISTIVSATLVGTAGAAAGRAIKKAWKAVLATIDVKDRRLVGPAAEMILHGHRDMRRAAEHTVRRLLPKTRPEQGSALSREGVEGILAVLRNSPTAVEAEAALKLLSYRHEERPLEVAAQYAVTPGTFIDPRHSLEEVQRVQAAAKRAVASIQANRAVYKEQSTLLRPARGIEEEALLRPAANVGTSEEQLLRSARSGDD
jgi:hypothetical protein